MLNVPTCLIVNYTYRKYSTIAGSPLYLSTRTASRYTVALVFHSGRGSILVTLNFWLFVVLLINVLSCRVYHMSDPAWVLGETALPLLLFFLFQFRLHEVQ